MSKRLAVTFASTSTSTEITPNSKDCVIEITGLTAGSGTIQLQRKVDGTNWRSVESYTTDQNKLVDVVGAEKYRLECTVYSSGSFVCFLGRPR